MLSNVLNKIRNDYVLAKVLTFLIVFVFILGITSVVYLQPQPTPTYINEPFVSYYINYNYSTQSNGTVLVNYSALDTPMIYFAGYSGSSVVIAEQFLNSSTYYSSENPVTLASNTTQNFLWWIPPWLTTGTPVNESSDIGIVVGQTQLSVQGVMRNTIVVFYSGPDRTIIANYDANSGFLVQLEIKGGATLSIYQLQSTLPTSLSVSNTYYAEIVLFILLIPSMAVFIATLPWPWRKWGQSLLKTLRQKI
jgi:hypothetical protein